MGKAFHCSMIIWTMANLLLIATSCGTLNGQMAIQSDQVGAINDRQEWDDVNFEPCVSPVIKQYHHFNQGLAFEGEKPALEKVIHAAYPGFLLPGESGWIRIRFVVNCRGEAGWYRISGADENYVEKQFDSSIIEALLEATSSLNGWKILPSEDEPEDYYQYLLFHMEDGRIKEIRP